MAVPPILQSGLNGIQSGLKGMNRAAQDIADLNLDDRSNSASDNDVVKVDASPDRLTDAVEAIVDLRVHARQVQASAKVVATADEVLGFLLDVRA
ncbi:MAG TPA: flagellar biosynthesis protein FlgE [Pseudomonadales bacterium]|nr:flagellar biosynthesis protein FlgE [Pseudomonadales bacterium]